MRFRDSLSSRAALLALTALCAFAPGAFAAPYEADGDDPYTLSALTLMPETAQVAVGYPPLDGLAEKIVALAKRTTPAAEVDAERDRILGDIASETGVYDAKSLGDIAAAKGLDPKAPIAVFADFKTTFDSMIDAEAKAASAEEEKKKEVPDSADAAADTEEEDAKAEFDFGAHVEGNPPHWAAVLGVADKAKVEASIQEDLIDAIPEISGETKKTEELSGVTVNLYGDYAYFVTDKYAVLGNSDLVKAVAGRLDNAAKFSYGTEDCPAYAKDELAALIYGKRLFELAKPAAQRLAAGQDYAVAMQAQIKSFEKWFENAEDDPMVMTLGATEQDISLVVRTDTSKSPGFLQFAGPAAPPRLAQVLPAHTLAFLSMRITDEYKKFFKEEIAPSIKESMQGDPQAAQVSTYIQTALDMIGNEITIGITGVKDDFPEAYAMLSLSNPAASGLLQMLVPAMPAETYVPEGAPADTKGVDILSIAAPIPIPLSISYMDDVVLVSNNVPGMKGIIDLLLSKKTSEFFSKLDPAVDPKMPMYSGLLVNTKLVSDILPVIALAGGGAGDIEPILKQVSANVREVRAFSEMKGDWSVNYVRIYLNPPAPAETAKAEAK